MKEPKNSHIYQKLPFLTMPRVTIRLDTSAGGLLFPPHQQIHVIKSDGSRSYAFVHELRPGDTILKRVEAAEGLTLEGHIIPSLWRAHKGYNADRMRLYQAIGSEMPTITTLSAKLKEFAASQEWSDDVAVDELHGKLPEGSCVWGTVNRWYNGEVMLPRDPDILYNFSKDLGDWATEENLIAAATRIRVLHSGLRAMAVRPKGEGTGKSKKGQTGNTLTEGVAKGILAEGVRLLKQEYGEDTFVEFVLDVKVTKVTEVKVTEAEKTNGERTGISANVVGFSARDEETKSRTLSSYKGLDRGSEIEALLKKKKELIIDKIPGLLVQLDIESLRRAGRSLQQLGGGGTRQTEGGIFSFIPVASPPLSSLEDDSFSMGLNNLGRNYTRSSRLRHETSRLLRLPPSRLVGIKGDFEFVGRYLSKVMDIYERSPIERSIFTPDQFLSAFSPVFQELASIRTYKNPREEIEYSRAALERERRFMIEKTGDLRIKLHEIYESVPPFLLVLQDCISMPSGLVAYPPTTKFRELARRDVGEGCVEPRSQLSLRLGELGLSYGITDMHNYHEGLISAYEARLAAYANAFRL